VRSQSAQSYGGRKRRSHNEISERGVGMDRKRLVLIGLAGAIVLALAAAWAVPRFTSRDNTGGVIRIAIATDETIERLATDMSTNDYAERNAAAVEQQLKAAVRAPSAPAAQQQQRQPQTPPQTQQPGNTAPTTSSGASEQAEPQASTFPSAVAAAFSQILLLQLDGQLTQGLDSSQRFDVVDTNAVETALRTMTARNNGSSPRTLFATVFRSQDGDNGEQIRQRRTSNADLASIGRELNADYFLYVGVEEPVYTAALEHDEYTGESVFVLRAQPTVAFRLFNTRRKTVELAGVIRFDEPLVAYSDLGDLDGYLVNEPGSGVQQQATPALQRLRDMPLMQDLAFQVNREIARQVIQRVLDQIAPSEIIRGGDAPIVNRGSNDGLAAGMQMDVYRMGEALRESGGRAVGAERTHVATVEVTDDIQDNVATLRVLSGGPVQREDRIELPLSLAELVSDTGPVAGGPSSTQQPTALGRNAIIAAQSGEPDAIRPAIAVDSIIVRFGDIGITTPANLISRSAGNSIGDALQSDPRVHVVSRADMARLSRERRIAARASGRSGADPRRGMAVGEYFLTGEVSLDLADATRSVTYEGVSRRVGPERRNWVAGGTFRVLTMDGRIEHAVEVEATRAVQQSINTDVIELIDDLSNDAVRKLLTELFPMQVLSASPNGPVRISGGTDFGITMGARLRAYTIGAPEYDPTTRVMLSAGQRTHAGDLIVTDVEPRVATARYAERPFQLNAGDVIELAPAPRRAAASRPAQATVEPQSGGATPF